MKVLGIFKGPLQRDARPDAGAVLSRRFVTARTVTQGPGRRRAHEIAMLALVCASPLAGCAGDGVFGGRTDLSGGAQSARLVSTASNAGYLVGPTDVLEISVFKVPELSKAVQVADTGTINLPLVGEVRVAGKTANEIEQDLTRQLGARYLKSPQVTVMVKDHNSQRVTIEGAVRRPGVYPIKGSLSLIQLIASAEGVERDYYSKDVTVFSVTNGNRTSRVYDIDAIREGKAQDIALHQGDLVVVDTSAAKTAFQNALKIVPAAATLRPY